MSNWAGAMCVTVPIQLKSQSTSRSSEDVAERVEVMTVAEARTKEAVLGMARTTMLEDGEGCGPLGKETVPLAFGASVP